MAPRCLAIGLALLFTFLAEQVAFGQDVPKKPKKQTAAAPAAEQPQVRIFTVRDADATEIVRTLKDLFPGDAAKKMRIALHQSTNSILLLGEVDDLERAESVIMRLDVVAAEQKKTKPENNRPTEKKSKQPEGTKEQLALAEANVEQSRERVAWSERMVKLGYLSAAQANAERSRLDSALELLAQARGELKTTIWEYKVLHMDTNQSPWEAELKKVGEDGWELAGVVEKTTGARTSSTILLFKRVKR